MTTHMRLAFAAALSLAFLSACGDSSPSAETAAREPAPPQSSWARHRDPRGFSLDVPPAWSVRIEGERLITVRSPAGSRLVLIYPVVTPLHTDCESWMRRIPPLLQAQLPGASLGNRRRIEGPVSSLLVNVSFRLASRPARAHLLCSIDEGSGMIFGIASTEAGFEDAKYDLTRIASSFAASPVQSNATLNSLGAMLRYATFVDPSESAFTAEVPEGWKTQGGLVRSGPSDVRPYVRAISPDGKITVTMGDSRVQVFQPMNQHLFTLGLREGSWYSPSGQNRRLQLRPYQTGAVFAADYASHLANGLATIRDRRERPDLSEALLRAGNPGAVVFAPAPSAGEAAFTVDGRGKETGGYVVAATESVSAPGDPVWAVTSLYSFVAPPEQIALAGEVMTHLARGFQVNPQWAAMHPGDEVRELERAGRTGDAVARAYASSYWTGQRSQDKVSSLAGAILGSFRIEDASTGLVFVMSTRGNLYWRRDGAPEAFTIDVSPMLLSP